MQIRKFKQASEAHANSAISSWFSCMHTVPTPLHIFISLFFFNSLGFALSVLLLWYSFYSISQEINANGAKKKQCEITTNLDLLPSTTEKKAVKERNKNSGDLSYILFHLNMKKNHQTHTHTQIRAPGKNAFFQRDG